MQEHCLRNQLRLTLKRLLQSEVEFHPKPEAKKKPVVQRDSLSVMEIVFTF